MKHIRLLTVGRLKTPHWREAAAYYAKRLSRSLRLEEVVVRDADAALRIDERKHVESSALFQKIRTGDLPVCLDEAGKTMTSREFAAFLGSLFDVGMVPCFLVGGAYGLTVPEGAAPVRKLSFGPMTFPHELARVVLLEQIYRANQILLGTGYHH